MDRDLKEEYFEWMLSLVYDENAKHISNYDNLLNHLHDIDFDYILPLDHNRIVAATNFRYRFGIENGVSDRDIKDYLDDTRDCSVLELMIALAVDCEESIMTNLELGDRTGQWFWNMIVNLGLGKMTNANYDEDYVNDRILIFMNREYDQYGHGGLFTVEKPYKDMRATEIWYQLCWYLNENYSE